MLVDDTEVVAAKKATIRRVRGWVGGAQHEVFHLVDACGFFACMTSPQHEHQPLSFLVELVDNAIGKFFPTFSCVGFGGAGADTQGRVEEQHTLFCPRGQIPVFGDGDAETVIELLKYIL